MITFSGIDCSGKTTQIDKVYEYFCEQDIRCKVIHSRGGYTPLLEFLKNIIRRGQKGEIREQNEYRERVHGSDRKRKTLLWLSIADLALFYGIYFRFVELFGSKILADRYFWDSYIDFKIKYPNDNFTMWGIWKIAERVYQKPEISIIYTIPAELSMYRSELKDEPWPEPRELREFRISKYMEEIDNNRWDCVIDSSGSIDEVFSLTVKNISEHLKGI